ncbi:hypothetical protein SK128_016348 [Halocaridina rubra]|uniref:Uncharacterized protein n=1 Tax=Halocaridina rubra TaxID=373956 RepID=A0AAN8WP14_HALRR
MQARSSKIPQDATLASTAMKDQSSFINRRMPILHHQPPNANPASPAMGRHYLIGHGTQTFLHHPWDTDHASPSTACASCFTIHGRLTLLPQAWDTTLFLQPWDANISSTVTGCQPFFSSHRTLIFLHQPWNAKPSTAKEKLPIHHPLEVDLTSSSMGC